MKHDNRLCVWWVGDDGTECGQTATYLVSQPGRHKMPVCKEHAQGYVEDPKFTVENIDGTPNDHSAECGTAA